MSAPRPKSILPVGGAKARSKHPRVKRSKPQPVDWRDPHFFWCEPGSPEERFRRAELFRQFQQFVRDHGAWIVSMPAGRVRVQAPKGSPLVEALRSLKRYPMAAFPDNDSTRLVQGRFVPVDTFELELWKDRPSVQPR